MADKDPGVPWAADDDELRRVFIIQEVGTADVDGKILVSNMELIFRWLKGGEVPDVKPKLR